MVGRSTAYILSTRKAPDKDDWFVAAAVDQFWQDYQNDGKLQLATAFPDSRIRASWAGNCARQVAYGVAGAEETDPVGAADAYRFAVGTLVHETVQQIVLNRFPGSESEYKVRISDLGSGHIDIRLVIKEGDEIVRRINIELKTINGWGYRRMFGINGEGPRYGGVIQGAISAAYCDPPPDEIILAVFSLEVTSPREAAKLGLKGEYKRFAAQWTYTKDEYMALAQEEIARLRRIVQLVDNGDLHLVPRIIPDPSLPPHEVINPLKGTIRTRDHEGVANGQRTVWMCGYCRYQSRCQSDFEKEESAKLEFLLMESKRIADGTDAP